MKACRWLAASFLSCTATVVAQDDPDYPLGKIAVPPVTERAEPLRLFDLAVGLSRDGSTVSDFETRLKLGGHAFFGGEVRGERLGAFFDTQRLELGVSEEEGVLDLESSYRASFFLATVDARKRRDDTWNLVGTGSLRLSPDWELIFDYQHDTDDSRGGPPSLQEFIETSRLPPLGRPTRVVRSGSAGFLYQRRNHLELEGDLSVARVRTEAGFDQTRSRARGSAIWNVSNLELDGRLLFDRITGRVARTEGLTEVNASFRFASYFVATAGTLQRWQPGVERFLRDYRAGVTFFGRRFRFARSSDFADDVLKLARRANELGYNERRVYDIESLRAFRERLSLSPARAELAEAIDALYLAQVRERNVPQLGFEWSLAIDEIVGSETDAYRVVVGIPWRLAWPFSRGEERVEFLRFEWRLRDERFESVGRTSRSHVLTATAELSRQHILRFRWESPGQTPEEVAFRIRRGRRWSADYIYALGR